MIIESIAVVVEIQELAHHYTVVIASFLNEKICSLPAVIIGPELPLDCCFKATFEVHRSLEDGNNSLFLKTPSPAIILEMNPDLDQWPTTATAILHGSVSPDATSIISNTWSTVRSQYCGNFKTHLVRRSGDPRKLAPKTNALIMGKIIDYDESNFEFTIMIETTDFCKSTTSLKSTDRAATSTSTKKFKSSELDSDSTAMIPQPPKNIKFKPKMHTK
jgi:hypothetical protein